MRLAVPTPGELFPGSLFLLRGPEQLSVAEGLTAAYREQAERGHKEENNAQDQHGCRSPGVLIVHFVQRQEIEDPENSNKTRGQRHCPARESPGREYACCGAGLQGGKQNFVEVAAGAPVRKRAQNVELCARYHARNEALIPSRFPIRYNPHPSRV